MTRPQLPCFAGQNVCRLVTFSIGGALGGGAGFDDLERALDAPGASEAEILDKCRMLVRNARQVKRLPPVVPVTSTTGDQSVARFTDDLGTTLAVLARSSDKVFVRRHKPIISRERLERTVTLVLPRSWSP